MRRPSSHRRVRRAAVTVAVGTLVAATAAYAAPSPGARGIGDPYYPLYGNGGYDVSHYDIAVSYTPSNDRVVGTTTITATATQDLSRFDLDLALPASSVTVDGVAAGFRQGPHELVVTPARPVRNGRPLTVVVQYAGIPSQTSVDGLDPWVRTADGAVAVGEPEIAAWWFPSNDHPRDKATFDIAVTVPTGVEALSNGVLRSKTTSGTTDTWSWRESSPMATYLAFMAVGQFDVRSGTSATGLPWVTAVAANGGAEGRYAAADLARSPEVVDWHAKQWGPYPFDVTGGVAPAADFGFALENQTRPVYTRGFWSSGSNIYVVVHELAHQWYGDSVSVTNWKDIWLNEGFATFAEWRWSETHGEGTAQQLLRASYDGIPAGDSFWTLPIGNPGAHREFSGAVYTRGAMTLQALRNRVGDPAFFQIMREWARQHAYVNGQVSQFISLAEQLSGQDLDGFFQAWLYAPKKPAPTSANGLADRSKVDPAAVPSKRLIDAVTAAETTARTGAETGRQS